MRWLAVYLLLRLCRCGATLDMPRYRDDCKKLAHFVHRVESFLMETEDDVDMEGPGWQAAFTVSAAAGGVSCEGWGSCSRQCFVCRSGHLRQP